jgi:hypothetical protein
MGLNDEEPGIDAGFLFKARAGLGLLAGEVFAEELLKPVEGD